MIKFQNKTSQTLLNSLSEFRVSWVSLTASTDVNFSYFLAENNGHMSFPFQLIKSDKVSIRAIILEGLFEYFFLNNRYFKG